MHESRPSLLSGSVDDPMIQNEDKAAQSHTSLNQLISKQRVSFYEGLEDQFVYQKENEQPMRRHFDKQHKMMMTKSTLVGKQTHKTESNKQGYMSDFYLNNENGLQPGRLQAVENSESIIMGQLVGGNQLSSKKFFKSKIDFSAPIKSLQPQVKQYAIGSNLSDNSAEEQFQQPQRLLAPEEGLKQSDFVQLDGFTNLSLIRPDESQNNRQNIRAVQYRLRSDSHKKNQGLKENKASLKLPLLKPQVLLPAVSEKISREHSKKSKPNSVQTSQKSSITNSMKGAPYIEHRTKQSNTGGQRRSHSNQVHSELPKTIMEQPRRNATNKQIFVSPDPKLKQRLLAQSLSRQKQNNSHDLTKSQQGSMISPQQTKDYPQAKTVVSRDHPLDPELIRRDVVIPSKIEEEIKEGFFELKQKFKDVGSSSIYISHVIMHEKHPILKKVELATLRSILNDSSVVYLNSGQFLYRAGQNDQLIYIILFGKLQIMVDSQQQQGLNGVLMLGRLNLGWTVGEEILFDRSMQIRREHVVAETETCLVAIHKKQLSRIQMQLLEDGNKRDYFVLESTLKGNYLIKDEWRKQLL